MVWLDQVFARCVIHMAHNIALWLMLFIVLFCLLLRLMDSFIPFHSAEADRHGRGENVNVKRQNTFSPLALFSDFFSGHGRREMEKENTPGLHEIKIILWHTTNSGVEQSFWLLLK